MAADAGIVAFLAARLAEDWAVARNRELAAGLSGSRATRQVEASRAILAWHAAQCTCSWCTDDGDDLDGPDFAPACPTLCFLAAIYSDHPDYRQEWDIRPAETEASQDPHPDELARLLREWRARG